MDPNTQSNQPLASGQAKPKDTQAGGEASAQAQPQTTRTDSPVAVPQQVNTQTVAQQQSASNMFSQSTDYNPPVPSQSVSQNQSSTISPPPTNKGGIFKKILIFLVLLILLASIGTGIFLFTRNNSVETTVNQEESNDEIDETTTVQDDVAGSLFANVDNQETDVSIDQQRILDMTAILEAIQEFYVANIVLPDTDNDSSVDNFPIEWTCIGQAPQCYNLENAGIETSTTIVPDYLPEMPIDPDGGFLQDSGYQLIYNPDTLTITVGSSVDPNIFVDGTIEQ